MHTRACWPQRATQATPLRTWNLHSTLSLGASATAMFCSSALAYVTHSASTRRLLQNVRPRARNASRFVYTLLDVLYYTLELQHAECGEVQPYCSHARRHALAAAKLHAATVHAEDDAEELLCAVPDAHCDLARAYALAGFTKQVLVLKTTARLLAFVD